MKNKCMILLLFMLIGSLHSMEPPIHPKKVSTEVEAYFMPYDKVQANEKLNELIDNAKHDILIAMYWITDDVIINKLNRLKKRGFNIQIIVDEASTPYEGPLAQKLLRNNIIPIIFPSKSVTAAIALMHNKFLVIDNTVVVTGSANLTKTAFTPSSRFSNYENIIIIQSPDIAAQFVQTFHKIETDIFDLYIQRMAFAEPTAVPPWLIDLSKQLYEHNPQFKLQLDTFFDTQARRLQRHRLSLLFPHIYTIEYKRQRTF